MIRKCAKEYDVRNASNKNGYLAGGCTKRYNKCRMTAPPMEQNLKTFTLNNWTFLSSVLFCAGQFGKRKKRAKRAM